MDSSKVKRARSQTQRAPENTFCFQDSTRAGTRQKHFGHFWSPDGGELFAYLLVHLSPRHESACASVCVLKGAGCRGKRRINRLVANEECRNSTNTVLDSCMRKQQMSSTGGTGGSQECPAAVKAVPDHIRAEGLPESD